MLLSKKQRQTERQNMLLSKKQRQRLKAENIIIKEKQSKYASFLFNIKNNFWLAFWSRCDLGDVILILFIASKVDKIPSINNKLVGHAKSSHFSPAHMHACKSIETSYQRHTRVCTAFIDDVIIVCISGMVDKASRQSCESCLHLLKNVWFC